MMNNSYGVLPPPPPGELAQDGKIKSENSGIKSNSIVGVEGLLNELETAKFAGKLRQRMTTTFLVHYKVVKDPEIVVSKLGSGEATLFGLLSQIFEYPFLTSCFLCNLLWNAAHKEQPVGPAHFVDSCQDCEGEDNGRIRICKQCTNPSDVQFRNVLREWVLYPKPEGSDISGIPFCFIKICVRLNLIDESQRLKQRLKTSLQILRKGLTPQKQHDLDLYADLEKRYVDLPHHTVGQAPQKFITSPDQTQVQLQQQQQQHQQQHHHQQQQQQQHSYQSTSSDTQQIVDLLTDPNFNDVGGLFSQDPYDMSSLRMSIQGNIPPTTTHFTQQNWDQTRTFLRDSMRKSCRISIEKLSPQEQDLFFRHLTDKRTRDSVAYDSQGDLKKGCNIPSVKFQGDELELVNMNMDGVFTDTTGQHWSMDDLLNDPRMSVDAVGDIFNLSSQFDFNAEDYSVPQPKEQKWVKMPSELGATKWWNSLTNESYSPPTPDAVPHGNTGKVWLIPKDIKPETVARKLESSTHDGFTAGGIQIRKEKTHDETYYINVEQQKEYQLADYS